jgi:acetyl-CoA synthetase
MPLVTPPIHRWLEDGRRDPEAFWARAARDLPWFRTWDRVFEWTPPTFRWFPGAETNLCWNALDHHVDRGWGGHAALVYLNERGERRVFTYRQLLHAVRQAAAALRALGLGAGDRLTIYMPTCPEAIVLMLAAVRIGAIHSVVFAGFGARALGDRIRASGSRAVFTADVTCRKGRDVPLLPIVEDALRETAGHGVRHLVVLDRSTSSPLPAGDASTSPARLSWSQFLSGGAEHDGVTP